MQNIQRFSGSDMVCEALCRRKIIIELRKVWKCLGLYLYWGKCHM